MKTILVTGANGFIGKTVTTELLKAGYNVVAMIRSGSLTPFAPHKNLSVLRADITEYDSYANRIKNVEAIVHLAANKYHPKLSFAVNLAGAHHMVRLCKENKFKTKRLINISSQSTKIKFRGVYGESKRQSDEIIEQESIDWTTLKPSLVYGAGDETLFQTIRKYTEKLPVVPVIGNGTWELYPIDVIDLSQAIIKTIETPKSIHKVYDLGDPKKITFDNLVRLIQKEIGISKPIVHVPAIIGLVGVYVATKLIPGFPISVDNVLGSTQNTDCNPKPAIKDLQLKLVSTKAGVAKYLGKTEKPGKKIVMVGLGKMGIMHATALSVVPGAHIVAIVDQDESLGQTALSMGIDAHFYPSLKEALAHESVDAVFICTPTFAHKEIIELCLAKNIPFFVEKPVYTNYQDFKSLMKTKYKKTLSASVAGYFWIYKREIEYTKKLLSDNVIGTVKSYSIDLKHSEVFGPKKGWLFKKSLSGGGVLANPGPHAFSIIQYLFGKGLVTGAKIEYLYGNEVEDKAKLSLSHKSIEGTLEANWSIKGYPVMQIEYEIRGTTGSIKFSNKELVIKSGKKITKLPYYAIPVNHKVYNLNPKSGGEAYYIEDQQFIDSLMSSKHKNTNDLQFASDIEAMINEAYEKGK
jgi:predicted dehydrogenase/nucleoside-diphosphate-sugar epimerase